MFGCDAPLQSVAMSIAAGGVAGVLGMLAGLGPISVATLAGMCALCGEVAAGVGRGNQGWRAVVVALSGRLG